MSKRTPQPHGQRLGQHFLFDRRILERIADTAEVSSEDFILEVGPGLGTLTQCLAERARKVLAVELDTSLEARFRERLAGQGNVELIHGDIMKIDLGQVCRERFEGRPFKVVANLPYYITTPVIMLFLESDLPVSSLTVMVQKEVADRLASPPGGRDYGAISVSVQYRTVVEKSFLVPAGAFSPPPRVQSAVLRMVTRDAPPVAVQDEALFRQVVKGCFSTRRKMLRNNVSAFFGLSGDDAARLLARAGIDPTERAEQLGLKQFADLANAMADSRNPANHQE